MTNKLIELTRRSLCQSSALLRRSLTLLVGLYLFHQLDPTVSLLHGDRHVYAFNCRGIEASACALVFSFALLCFALVYLDEG